MYTTPRVIFFYGPSYFYYIKKLVSLYKIVERDVGQYLQYCSYGTYPPSVERTSFILRSTRSLPHHEEERVTIQSA